MARYTLKKHAAADTVKWVIIFLIAIGLIGAVVTLFVMLDRQTTVTEIGVETYTIAALDDSGEQTDGDGRRRQFAACRNPVEGFAAELRHTGRGGPHQTDRRPRIGGARLGKFVFQRFGGGRVGEAAFDRLVVEILPFARQDGADRCGGESDL